MHEKSGVLRLLTILWNRVENQLPGSFGTGDDILLGNHYRIPVEIFTDDEKLQKIMKEFELDKPEQMIRFMVESFYGAFEAIQNEVIELKLMQINEPVGMIQSAKRMYNYGIENPEDKVNKLNTAQNDLFRAAEILKRQVSSCIQSTRAIDGKSKWEFFVKAKEHMKTINSNIRIIRLSLDAIEDAVSMQMLIANDLGKKIESSVFRPYEEFYDTVLLSGDTCRLLQAYEFQDRAHEKYFMRLPERRKNIRELGTAYEEYVDELEGYDNVVF